MDSVQIKLQNTNTGLYSAASGPSVPFTREYYQAHTTTGDGSDEKNRHNIQQLSTDQKVGKDERARQLFHDNSHILTPNLYQNKISPVQLTPNTVIGSGMKYYSNMVSLSACMGVTPGTGARTGGVGLDDEKPRGILLNTRATKENQTFDSNVIGGGDGSYFAYTTGDDGDGDGEALVEEEEEGTGTGAGTSPNREGNRVNRTGVRGEQQSDTDNNNDKSLQFKKRNGNGHNHSHPPNTKFKNNITSNNNIHDNNIKLIQQQQRAAAILTVCANAYQLLCSYQCRECVALLHRLPPSHFLSGWVQHILGKAYCEVSIFYTFANM